MISSMKNQKGSAVIWIIIIIAILIIAGGIYFYSQPKQSATADWQTYTNSQYGFSFQYPATTTLNFTDLPNEGIDRHEIFYVGTGVNPLSIGVNVRVIPKESFITDSTSHSKYVYTYMPSDNTFGSAPIEYPNANPSEYSCPPTYSLNGNISYIEYLSGYALSLRGSSTQAGNDDSTYAILTNKDYVIEINFADGPGPTVINQILNSFKLIGDTTVTQANCKVTNNIL